MNGEPAEDISPDEQGALSASAEMLIALPSTYHASEVGAVARHAALTGDIRLLKPCEESLRAIRGRLLAESNPDFWLEQSVDGQVDTESVDLASLVAMERQHQAGLLSVLLDQLLLSPDDSHAVPYEEKVG